MSKSDDFFGGAPSLSWARQDAHGEWVDVPELLNVPRGGVVTAVGEPVQMTEMGTGKPLWWKEPSADSPQGQPKVKIVITLRCDGTGRGADERDRTDPSDLGERQLHVQSKDMRDAIGSACRKTGSRGVRVGSELYVAWTGKRPSKIKNAKAARTWTALYVPHEVDVAADGNPNVVWGNGPDAGQQGQQQAAPASPPPAQAPPPATPPWQQPAQQVPVASVPAPAGPPPAAPWEQPAAQTPALPPWMQGK